MVLVLLFCEEAAHLADAAQLALLLLQAGGAAVQSSKARGYQSKAHDWYAYDRGPCCFEKHICWGGRVTRG